MKVDFDGVKQNLSGKLNICPICGNSQFIMGDEISTLLNVDDKGKIKIGGKLLPLVNITCDSCGYTMLFNAKILGCLNEE